MSGRPKIAVFGAGMIGIYVGGLLARDADVTLIGRPSMLDALAGGVFGLARGVLLLFIFFALVPIIQAVVPIQQITDLLNASRLAPLFDSQLILSILGA